MLRHLAALLALSSAATAETATLRVGYFPNVTHAQALVGCQTTREGRGWFEQRLGPGVTVQWFAYNAGPSAMEAIFAGSLDLTYTGPNPALNAYIRSRGEEIRILAGSAEGGSALVVHRDDPAARPADFKGRRLATPQLGNTQDVAARVWLRSAGLKVTMTGGDVLVVPTANADQLPLFTRGEIDGVWTVEPWVSRLELQASGRVLVEQKDAVTTVLAASSKFLTEHPDLADRFRKAHSELTAWIVSHPAEARKIAAAALEAETHRPFPAEILDRAWGRMRFTDRIDPARFDSLVADAQSVGFLRKSLPLDRLFSGKP